MVGAVEMEALLDQGRRWGVRGAPLLARAQREAIGQCLLRLLCPLLGQAL